MGGVLWSPRGTHDRLRESVRAVEFFYYVLNGRRAPEWQWWRPEGTWQHAHQYRAAFTVTPDAPARCGHYAREVQAWEVHTDHQCPKCLLLEQGVDRTEAAKNRHRMRET